MFNTWVTQDETWVLFEPLLCKEDDAFSKDPFEQRARAILTKLTNLKALFLLSKDNGNVL